MEDANAVELSAGVRPLDVSGVYAPIQSELTGLKRRLKETLQEDSSELDDIHRFVVQHPGKMLRPALVMLSAMAARRLEVSAGGLAGGLSEAELERVRNLALVMELLHNASLVHDDVIDEAEHRRGTESLNARYSGRIAVLGGDVLFSKAFGILARHFEPPVSTSVTDVTARMCKGEILAALRSGRKITSDEYYEITRMKTAEFAGVCSYAGALLVDRPELAEELRLFGLEFGVAYQIVDDYVDGDYEHVDGFEIDWALTHAERAKQSIQRLPTSASARLLGDFVDMVLSAAGIPRNE